MVEDPTDFGLEILDQGLVANVVYRDGRKDPVPMLHQARVGEEIAPERLEIRGIGDPATKRREEARQADIPRIANTMEDAGIGHGKSDDANDERVRELLVHDAATVGSRVARAHIAFGNIAEVNRQQI